MTALATPPRRRIRDDYLELVREFPIREIKNGTQHREAGAILRRLMLKPKRTAGETDYLGVLALLVDEYEHRTWPLPHGTSDERLRFIVEESGLGQAGLAKLLGVKQPAASMILTGKRSLTVEHVRRLAERFKLDAGYFI